MPTGGAPAEHTAGGRERTLPEPGAPASDFTNCDSVVEELSASAPPRLSQLKLHLSPLDVVEFKAGNKSRTEGLLSL